MFKESKMSKVRSGFHVSTYTLLTPYLKGLHLTRASHHAGRDACGWRMPNREWAAYLHESVENGRLSEEEAELLAQASAEPKAPKMDERDHYTPLKEVIWQQALALAVP